MVHSVCINSVWNSILKDHCAPLHLHCFLHFIVAHDSGWWIGFWWLKLLTGRLQPDEKVSESKLLY